MLVFSAMPATTGLTGQIPDTPLLSLPTIQVAEQASAVIADFLATNAGVYRAISKHAATHDPGAHRQSG